MKIFVTGTRGIPDIPGGVEKHCQELFPRIARSGHEVILATRASYVTDRLDRWKGVKLVHLFAPRKKSLEAIIHTTLAVLTARLHNPDILHINAIGPSLLVPLARLLGMKVVMTNHGPDYDRQKWGRLAKAMLRLGEKLGGLFANEVIVISNVIADILRTRCGRESHLIYNGVPIPEPSTSTDYLEGIGAETGRYVLAVVRFVPEKGITDLIQAFTGMDTEMKLVIAGDADHETEYSRKIRQLARADSRIILTGYITGEPLHQVFSHARLFVLPSYHEGLPIALLEAMSYGLDVLVSDIPANKEVGLAEDRYFICGNVEDLRCRMEHRLSRRMAEKDREAMRREVQQRYNWDDIAKQTIAVYERARKG
ncbi:MAG TPA: glycosyltransferase family 4 protein [Syntrophorhabdaceae bacterium]|nr:glycosyltransferase family 4 protein [Syntrophorhabdaceae bacterium]